MDSARAQGEAVSLTQDATALRLTARRQRPKTTGRCGWQIIEEVVVWRASETAVVIVDMWDTHWSRGAAERVNVLAPRINVVVSAARERGVQIIHAPSDVVEAYRDHPARRGVTSIPHAALPALDTRPDPPLPIDDSDEGSDTGEQTISLPWTCQHAAIDIVAGDLISADGQEIYNILQHQGRTNLIYMGVHTNMCVLNRPFGIKRMVRYGLNAVLARDLTDSMYNPLRPPYVNHDEGTQLVVGYIEKFWCPTITSDDLTMPA
jgi:nicotinamidase-related amidase